MKTEFLAAPLEDRGADDVRWKQVAGKLDARIMKPQKPGQQMCQGRFADTGEVLDEQVSTRQQAGERQLQLPFLAQNHVLRLLQDGLQLVRGSWNRSYGHADRAAASKLRTGDISKPDGMG